MATSCFVKKEVGFAYMNIDGVLRTQIENIFIQHFNHVKKELATDTLCVVEDIMWEFRFMEVEILQAIEDYKSAERGG